MDMLVVNVREVRVFVRDCHMPVRMHMRLLPVPVEVMRVLMVVVMHMRVVVLHRLVGVRVLMPLREV